MKRLIAISALFSSLFLGAVLCKTFVSAKKVQKPAQAQEIALWKSFYDNKLSENLVAIKKHFKVPTKTWNKAQKTIQSLKENDPLFSQQTPENPRPWSDHPLTKRVANLLSSYNLNPQAVEIVIETDPEKNSIAFTKQNYRSDMQEVFHKIIINADLLATKPLDIQEAILRHEIQHLINYDSLEEGFLWNMFQQLGYARNQWDNSPLLISMRHLRELRADQQAALSGGLKTAQAIAKDFSCCDCRHEGSISHPAPAKRIAQMNVVMNHMQNTLTIA